MKLPKIRSLRVRRFGERVSEVLTYFSVIILFAVYLALWFAFRSDTVKLSSYATFVMGLSTATLAFFTLFMATSTSRMAKESRLDRQREYVTELIALVIDPIFELVKEHQAKLSSRSLDWQWVNRVISEKYIAVADLATFKIATEGAELYYLPSVDFEIMKRLGYSYMFELRRSKEIEEYNRTLMSRIGKYDELARQFLKELGAILVSIHLCLVRSARFDAIENDIHPFLVALVCQKIALSDGDFKEILANLPNRPIENKAREIFTKADAFRQPLTETGELKVQEVLETSYSKLEHELREIDKMLERVRIELCEEFSISETAIHTIKTRRQETHGFHFP